ncbi:MAG: PAS domain S-box protein [Bacilli bacterium]
MNGKDMPISLEEEALNFEKYELRDEQLKVVADNLKLGLVLHDVVYSEEKEPIDCRCKYINETYEKITRRTKQELVGKLLSVAIASGKNDWLDKYKTAIIDNQVVSFDNYDGILKKWFNITAYSPNPTRLALLLTDISKRKDAEIALRKSEEENRVIINNLLIGIIVHNGAGEVITCNGEAANILGTTSDNLTRKGLEYPYYNFIHEDDLKPMSIDEFPVSIVLKTKKPLPNYVVGVLRNDIHKTFWLKCSATPVFINDKDIDKVIVSFVDITNQKQMEARIIEDAKELFNQKVQAEATLVSIGDGVIATDNQGMIRVFNAVAEQLTGWSKEEALGHSFENVFHIIKASNRKKHDNIVKKVLSTSKSVDLRGDNILLSHSGAEYYIENSATPIQTKEKGVIGVVLVFRDITDKVLLSKKLDLESQRLSQVVDVAVDMIFELDKDKRITYYSGHGFNKLGYNKLQIIGHKMESIFRDNPAIQNLAYLRAINGSPYSYDCNIERGNQNLWYEVTLSPLYGDDKTITGVLGVCRDITERKQGQQEIEYLSKHDFLTGLHNRHYFVNEMEKIDVEANYPLGVLMADLNGLKIFNDVYGHDIGDNALQAASQVFKTVAGKDDVLARIGGDEFAMLFPRTSKEKMVEVYNHIRKETLQKEVNYLPLSLAVGYEIKNTTFVDIKDAMKIAENRMYRLKLTESMRFRNDAIKRIIEVLHDRHFQLKVNSKIVSDLCRKTGEVLNLKEDAILELEQTGLLHNIGKIFISDEIIQKPDKLTPEEFQIVKLHSEKGYQILKVADKYSHLADYVLYHHEAWNGSGYPRGLKGNDIPLISRIVHMVDSYEAMTSPRPYRQSMSHQDAAREIINCAGKQFDPRIAKIFVEKVLGFELNNL